MLWVNFSNSLPFSLGHPVPEFPEKDAYLCRLDGWHRPGLTLRQLISRDKWSNRRGETAIVFGSTYWTRVRALYCDTECLAHKLKLNAEHDAIPSSLRLAFRGLVSHPPNRALIGAWCAQRLSGSTSEIKVCCQALLRLKPSTSAEQLHTGLGIMRFLQRVADMEEVKEIMGYMKTTFDKFLLQAGRTD